MASESVTNCLRNAIDVVRNSTALDIDSRQAVVDRLSQVLETRELPDRVVVSKMAYAMKDARRIAFINYVASQADDAALGRLKVVASKAEDGERLNKVVAPLVGNRGDPDIQSLQTEINAEVRMLHGRLRPVFDAIAETRLFRRIRDSENAGSFVLAAAGGRAANKQIAEAVKVWHTEMGKMLERLRAAGVWVEDLQNYFPQSHHFARIAADFDNWKQFIIDNLDPKYHTDRDAAAEAVFNSLRKEDPDEGPSQALITMARKLRFKSPEAAMEYHFRYGKDSVSGTVLRAAENVVSKTVLAEKLGPRAKQNYRKTANAVIESARDQMRNVPRNSARHKELQRQINHVEDGANKLDHITGDLTKPENQNLANWAGAIRNYLSFLYLGKVALSAVSQDTMIAMSSARFQTGGFASGAMEQIRAIFDVLGDQDARALVNELGLMPHVLAANAMQRLSSAQDMMHPVAGAAGNAPLSERALGASVQFSTWTQRVTGAQALEHGLRASFGLMTSRAMNRQRKYSWDQLDPRYRDVVLRRNGISEQEWEGMRKAGKSFRGTGALDTTSLPPMLRKKVETALIREAEIAVTFPTASDRMWATFGLRPGTISGELVGSMTQFLSWPISFFRNAVTRDWQAGGAGFYGFAGAMIAAGALQQQLYALADGDPLYEMDSPTLWFRAIGRSGLLTPIGEAAFGGLTNPQQNAIANPMFDTIFGGLKTISSASVDAANGDLDLAAGSVARQAQRLMVPNLWQINALVNRGMFYAMEELDPQYNDNVERQRERRGQTLEVVPQP